jgi:hypothetical protein
MMVLSATPGFFVLAIARDYTRNMEERRGSFR